MRIYLLYGDDDYAKEIFLKQQVGKFLRIRQEDPDKVDILKRAAGAIGFFAEGQFGVYAQAFDSWRKGDQSSFVETLQRLENSSLEVFIDVTSSIQMPAQLDVIKRRFELPKPWQEKDWINSVMEIAQDVGISISTEAAKELLKRLGHNKWAIHSELLKLSVLSNEVDVDLVNDMTPFIEPAQLETLMNSVVNRSRDSLSMISDILKDYDALLVVAALFGLFRDMYVILSRYSGEEVSWETVKNYSVALNIPVPRVAMILGFQFKPSKSPVLNPLNLWRVDEVEETLLRIQLLEMNIKDGEIDPKLGLMNFLSYILSEEVVRQ